MSSSGSSSSSLSLRPTVVGSFPLTVSFETSGKNGGASYSGASDNIEVGLVERRGPNSSVLHWRVNSMGANQSQRREIPLSSGPYFLKATVNGSVAQHDLAPFQRDPLESLQLNVSKDPVNLLNPDQVKTGIFSSSLLGTFLLPEGFKHDSKILTARKVEAQVRSYASTDAAYSLFSLAITFTTQTAPIPPDVKDANSTAPSTSSMGPVAGNGFTLNLNTSSPRLFKPTNAVVSLYDTVLKEFVWKGDLGTLIQTGDLEKVALSRDTELCVANEASGKKSKIKLFDLLTKQPPIKNTPRRQLSDIQAVSITINMSSLAESSVTEDIDIRFDFKGEPVQQTPLPQSTLYSLTESRQHLMRAATKYMKLARSFALVDRGAGSQALPSGESSSAASSSSSSAPSASFPLPQFGVQSGVDPSSASLLARTSSSAASSSSSAPAVSHPIKRKAGQSSGGGSGSP